MANGWTAERRKRQSLLIHTWNPSSKSTGPRTVEGKYRSNMNALKHGNRSKPTQEIISLFKELIHQQIQMALQINQQME